MNPILKPQNILVIAFDMVDLSVHQACFDQILNHFGKVHYFLQFCSYKKLNTFKSYFQNVYSWMCWLAMRDARNERIGMKLKYPWTRNYLI